MTGLSRQVDLRPGEQMRIWRRRMNFTRGQAARTLKRSRYWVGAVERGELDALPGDIPWTGSRDLAGHEKCVVYRLRSAVTQDKIAADLQRSRLWVNRMERGEVPCDELIWYWES